MAYRYNRTIGYVEMYTPNGWTVVNENIITKIARLYAWDDVRAYSPQFRKFLKKVRGGGANSYECGKYKLDLVTDTVENIPIWLTDIVFALAGKFPPNCDNEFVQLCQNLRSSRKS